MRSAALCREPLHWDLSWQPLLAGEYRKIGLAFLHLWGWHGLPIMVCCPIAPAGAAARRARTANATTASNFIHPSAYGESLYHVLAWYGESKTHETSNTTVGMLKCRRMIQETARVPLAESRQPWIKGAGAAVAAVAAVKLLLHLYAGRHYGYFCDELYYLACARHLAWGYVDQPPLIALVVAIVRAVLGDSLAAIRFLPALAGAGKVLLTGRIARELGGKRFAQGLAALCALAAPGFLALDCLLTMNAFEPLFWMGCAWLVIRIVRTGDTRLWLWFGLLAGIGLENKHSMLIFGFGVVAGLLLTPERRFLRTKWLWIGGLVAFLIFLPNLLWNIQYHFPFLELQANIRRSGRNVDLTPLAFLGQEILAMLPMSAPIWLAGLWFFFFRPEGKPFRALGWAWLATASWACGTSSAGGAGDGFGAGVADGLGEAGAGDGSSGGAGDGLRAGVADGLGDSAAGDGSATRSGGGVRSGAGAAAAGSGVCGSARRFRNLGTARIAASASTTASATASRP